MLSGLRVLLAEDNPTNQLVASQMLESLGASVVIAEDGIEARKLVTASAPFDVALIDIEMPRMNGIELLRHLRATEGPVAALPMIALTAYVMREHVAAIDAAGADGVIAKPILSIEQFGADICRFMRQRAALGGGAAGTAPAAGQSGAGADSGAKSGTTPGAGPTSAAEIDRGVYDTLAEIVGPAAMSELLTTVKSDLSTAIARLERAAAGPDIDEARAVSHVLISVAGSIGAIKAQDLARGMNRAAHAGDAGTVRRDAQALLAETRLVVDFVRSRAAGAAP